MFHHHGYVDGGRFCWMTIFLPNRSGLCCPLPMRAGSVDSWDPRLTIHRIRGESNVQGHDPKQKTGSRTILDMGNRTTLHYLISKQDTHVHNAPAIQLYQLEAPFSPVRVPGRLQVLLGWSNGDYEKKHEMSTNMRWSSLERGSTDI